MGWFGKLLSRPEQAVPAQRSPEQAVPPPGSVRLSADGRLSVVGESHYQPALKAAVGRSAARGLADAVPVTAVLVPEPTNRYDRRAVRVDVNGRTVGYLAREDAARYQPALLRLEPARGWCPGFVSSGELGLYGIWLHLAAPDRVVPVNSPDGLVVLAAERQVTVTREQDHQDALSALAAEAASADGPFCVFAGLSAGTATAGKHAGEPVVHVSVDRMPVGELTAMQSDRYAPLVGAAGAAAGCEATVRRDAKGVWQVEVQLPRTD
jgi:hypothetical protein